MTVVNLRMIEIEKTIDVDHIPAAFWKYAARQMQLIGFISELELLAKRNYAEALQVCEEGENSRRRNTP